MDALRESLYQAGIKQLQADLLQPYTDEARRDFDKREMERRGMTSLTHSIMRRQYRDAPEITKSDGWQKSNTRTFPELNRADSFPLNS
jgi:hypothetical protein